jgi:hypothetical protein
LTAALLLFVVGCTAPIAFDIQIEDRRVTDEPGLCRDNGGKARKFRDDKESLRHQRIELIGSSSGDAAVPHLAFPDHMNRLNA